MRRVDLLLGFGLLLALGVPAGSWARATDVLPRCSTGHLRISDGSVAGGLSHLAIDIRFTNRGSACRLGGYPGVDGLSARDRRLVSARRTPRGFDGGLPRGKTIRTIELRTGQTATARLEWINGKIPHAVCARVSALAITPPGDVISVRRPERLHLICSLQIHPLLAGDSGGRP